MRPRIAALLAVALLTLPLHASALAAAPQASLPDIEDEVMCTICGTLLELSDSPQAQREKAFIRQRIAEGKTKDEIKDELVAEYGENVLALPGDSGFDITAWLVPIIGVIAGIAAIAFGVIGWRHRRRETEATEVAPKAPEGAAAERLDADLARYDL